MIGPGLLGGSILLAARQFLPGVRLGVWSRRKQAVERASQLGVVDFTSPNLTEVVAEADLVILALPIQHMAPLAEGFPELGPDVIVTDVGSTKSSVVSGVGKIVGRLGGRFIGSHPMAGSEKTGIENASATLFQGATVILTPDGTDEAAVGRLEGFWSALGGRVIRLAAGDHDRMVATISHLPHLVAAALARMVHRTGAPEVTDLAGGGFRDTTRIAAGEPGMWCEIMADNRDALIREVDHIIDELDQWREALAVLDKDRLFRFLCEAREFRERF